MTQYIKNRNSKKLDDILLSGFGKQDTVFINWETVTKKGNIALKQAERKNLIEQIEQA